MKSLCVALLIEQLGNYPKNSTEIATQGLSLLGIIYTDLFFLEVLPQEV